MQRWAAGLIWQEDESGRKAGLQLHGTLKHVWWAAAPRLVGRRSWRALDVLPFLDAPKLCELLTVQNRTLG